MKKITTDILASYLQSKGIYEGYLWPSNEPTPIVCEGDVELAQAISQYYANKKDKFAILDTTNPFIVEGQLCNNEISISIKYVDGHYLIVEYTIDDYENVVATSFYSQRMGGRKLFFKQNWVPESDELCEGLDVLQPKEFVFVGFSKK